MELLGSLDREEWLRVTGCGWSVKDLALHLLDADLGWLSRGRDADMTSLLPMADDYREFVKALNQKNQRWVETAAGLSQRVVTDLLAWSGDQVAVYHDSLDPSDTSQVAWAGGEVPVWLGMGRDFTERWVHQKQMREALGMPGDHDRYLPVVLSIFVWAFPHQYRAAAEPSTLVNLDLGEPARWHLTRGHERWELEPGLAHPASAAIKTDMDTAWRLFTGAPYNHADLATAGPPSLTQPLLAIRGIIV